MDTIDIAIKKKFIIDRKLYHPSIKWSNDIDLINRILNEYRIKNNIKNGKL